MKRETDEVETTTKRRPPLRALIVSYSFPPVGGAGVARVTKLAKYLPDHGVTPAVLTVENPSVPLIDASRARDVAPEMDVLRVRTLEPGYAAKKVAWSAQAERAPSFKQRAVKVAAGFARQLLVPDPQVLWQPAAQIALARRLRSDARDDVVFISGPPFSQFLLAPNARLIRPGTAVVLDYRDEWSTYRDAYEMMGGLAARVGDQLERHLVRAAHAITTATSAFRTNLLARHPFLDPSAVTAIPNGYDPDDFPSVLPDPPSDRLVITYAGTVFKLTSLRGLLAAVRALHAAEPVLAKKLELRILGRVVDTELDSFEGTEALGVKRIGYVPHEQVVAELAASHVVLCALDDVAGVERIYPAKVFELMYLGRTCLTLSPPGALAELVNETRIGPVIPPRDVGAITAWLVARLRERERERGNFGFRAAAVGIEPYHRRALAGRFAEVFRDAQRRARAEA
jgi:glycosyltransferase involved in cell wall biosynthesis